MEYIKEFIKHKESKGEKAIYRVNDTLGYTYYSDDYVKWLEHQLRKHDVISCVCLNEIKTGTVAIHCCNLCGKPDEEWWCKN